MFHIIGLQATDFLCKRYIHNGLLILCYPSFQEQVSNTYHLGGFNTLVKLYSFIKQQIFWFVGFKNLPQNRFQMQCMAVPFWLSADAKHTICKAITLLKPRNFLLKIKHFVSNRQSLTWPMSYSHSTMSQSISAVFKIIHVLCCNYFDSV